MKWIRQHIVAHALFMLLAWMGYQYSVLLLSHVHVIDGVVYVHAHRSSDSASKGVQHTHTGGQLFVLDQLMHLSSEDVLHSPDLPLFCLVLGAVGGVLYLSACRATTLFAYRLRPPPFV